MAAILSIDGRFSRFFWLSLFVLLMLATVNCGEGQFNGDGSGVGEFSDDTDDDEIDDNPALATWKIYMAPRSGWKVNGVPVAGVDRNAGTEVKPVRTLRKVHEIVKKLIASGDELRNIEVLIAPLLYDYVNQDVVWTVEATMPKNKITFLPWTRDKQRPVFDGKATKLPCNPNNTKCENSKDYYSGVAFFDFRGEGRASNIEMRYLQIQNYAVGVVLRNAHRNTLYGMSFFQIGNLYQPNMAGTTAALSLARGSSSNIVQNSHFISVANNENPDFSYHGGDIHAIYISDQAHRNRIIENNFVDISGDAVRIRDFSNETFVERNNFTRAGLYANTSHWWNTSSPDGCPSFFTRFKDNIIDGLWKCSAYHPSTVKGFRTYVIERYSEKCPPLPAWDGPGMPPQHWDLSSNKIVTTSCPKSRMQAHEEWF